MGGSLSWYLARMVDNDIALAEMFQMKLKVGQALGSGCAVYQAQDVFLVNVEDCEGFTRAAIANRLLK